LLTGLQNASLTVYTPSGKAIAQFNTLKMRPTNTLEYALPRNLAKGVYLFRFVNGNAAVPGAFTVVK
jgi:hypothetical protein